MKRFQYRACDLEMDFCEDGHGYWLDEEGDKRILEFMKKEEVGLERKFLLKIDGRLISNICALVPFLTKS
jgi:hypothetical protein